MIFVVSTKVKSGKGGISTALAAIADAEPLQKKGITFVTSHDQNKSKLASFASAARTLFTSVKRGDFVWLHCGSWLSIIRKFILSMVARIAGGKVFFHFHGNEILPIIQSATGKFVLGLLCRYADGVVVLSPWWNSFFQSQYPWLKDKLCTCPNALTDSLLQQRDSKFDREGPVKLLAMSRLIEGKGFELVIDAMTLLPQRYSLSIAGEGAISNKLQQQVARLGLENRVEFLGWVDFEQKSRVFTSHDIFVLPSKNDSFGMVFLEAMAAGLPVVALDYNAVADVVPNHRAGELCLNESAEELCHCIQQCTDNWFDYHQYGKQYAIDQFNKNKISSDVLSFFETR